MAGPGLGHARAVDDLSFFDVVTTTRSIRRYRDEPVPEADLARILFAASRAPSGPKSTEVL